MPVTPVYARNPSIRGDQLVFVADDDLWSVPRQGGVAVRLTADSSPVSDPRISPDGSLVAYISRREGPPDLYVAGLGSALEARRLTYWADAGGRVIGWLPDGRIAVTTSVREASHAWTWAWAIPPDGGTPERLAYGPITGLDIDAGGAVIIGRHQSRHRGAAWKRYRGGTAGRLWIDPEGDGTFAPYVPELDGQLEDPGFCNGRVVFISDHEGFGNVYSATVEGTDLRRHTDHDDFYARAAATDGHRVVYQCAGDLWVLDDLTADSQAHQVAIELASAPVGRRSAPIAVPGKIGAVATDRSGRASAVEVEGNLVWLTHCDGPAPVLSTGSAVRARLPGVLGSTGRVAWVTDADGDDAIEVAAVAGSDPSTGAPSAGAVPLRFAPGRLGRVLELCAAPDGHHVAVANHEGAVIVIAIEDGTWQEVDRSSAGPASGLAWSADSVWLAWSHSGGGPTGAGDTQLRQIRLARVGGSPPGEPDDGSAPTAPVEVLEATPLRFDDHDPAFTLDGRYLAFLSARTFDPVYDEHVFDLGFLTVTRPYLLILGASDPSPFAPRRDGRPPAGAKDDSSDGGIATPSVAIDRRGLQDRVVAVPVEAGRYTHLQAVDGGLVWQVPPLAGRLGEDLAPGAEPPRSRLVHYHLAKRKQTTLAEAVDVAQVTGDGRLIVVVDKTALRVVPATQPAGSEGEDTTEVDLSRIRVKVDPPLRWLQMFDETVRLMRDHFWVEDMAGVDWTGAAARYRPLVRRLATRSDLSELLWELNGELGASHAYEMAPPRPVDDARKQGWLGADVVVDADGSWTIGSIIAAETSVPAARSPLLAPGVNIGAGDRLIAVDGQLVGTASGPAPLLIGAAERPVELTIRPGDGGSDRAVVVMALESERPLRYHAWVAGRRAATHEATGGRVGYVHIPDMQAPGWAELHRDLRFEIAREALIVDLRDNGGGHLSQLVLEKLSRQIIGWDTARHKPSSSYPADAPRGPLVAIVNEYAGSDGDIATAAFKRRHLGPVVGTRTWGGVIGIDGEYKLVDGTMVTQPRYSYWFDEMGWGVENYGVDPDVVVDVSPQDWVAGRDPQLDTAVRIALEALERQPALTPPDVSTRPSRTPPPLPGRPGWPESPRGT
jgi:tricorn protease